MLGRRLTRGFLVAFCVCVLCGCGESGAYSKPTAHLTGSVTIGGQPLPADADGTVDFMPSGGGGQAPPVSAVIQDGQYDAPEVPQGKVLVLFNIGRYTGRMIREDGGSPFQERENLVPAEAQQGIEIEVTEDAERDFDL